MPGSGFVMMVYFEMVINGYWCVQLYSENEHPPALGFTGLVKMKEYKGHQLAGLAAVQLSVREACYIKGFFNCRT